MDIVDSDHLLLLASDDKSVLLKIIKDFEQDAHRIVSECKAASSNNDLDLCKSLIHSLKGSSGSLGLSASYKLCLQMESSTTCSAFSSDLDELSTLLDKSVSVAIGLLS